MPQIYIKFPKTGLGNLLLVWARAIVFAKMNNMPYYTSSWWGLRWGALLRREQKKRLYWGYFIETPFLKQIQLLLQYRFGKTIIEPPMQIIPTDKKNEQLYVFNNVIIQNDLFGHLRDYHSLISDELNKILTSKMKNILHKSQPPVIGLHIRRGDFKKGNPITENEYFVKGINLIRSISGCKLPVTIFTDATKNEIEDVLLLPEVYLADNNPDIIDIILLSKSKYMLLSQSSTFSYWGAFLSNAIVIRPANDWQDCIKQNNNETGYCEIKWDYVNEDSTKFLTSMLINEGILVNK